MISLDELQRSVDDIRARNVRVEADKAWETSWTRRLAVLVLTYAVVVVFFFVAKLPDPFVSAAVPSVAFVLSTLSVSWLKRWWLGRVRGR